MINNNDFLLDKGRYLAKRLSEFQQDFLCQHDPDQHLRPICRYQGIEQRTRDSLLGVGLVSLYPCNAITPDQTKLTELGFYTRLAVLANMADRLMANGYEITRRLEKSPYAFGHDYATSRPNPDAHDVRYPNQSSR